MKYAAGIDVGGTNTRAALISETYEIIERKQFPTNGENPKETLEKIKDMIDGFGYPVEGIGISCPGPLDLIRGVNSDASEPSRMAQFSADRIFGKNHRG